MRHCIVTWSAVAIAVLAVSSGQARPIPLVKSSARLSSTSGFQLVGNGVYPATTSKCYGTNPAEIFFTSFGGYVLPAPSVVGVFWPGVQSPDPMVSSLFGDFVTDLFNGPYWSATMPQYMGSAHGIFQSNVTMSRLLTLAPSTTVLSSTITAELVAQQEAGVLPAPDPQGNTIYVVHFPPGVTITDNVFGTSCVQFCAYHDFDLDVTNSRYFTFVVMPDFSQSATCQAGCGSGSPFDQYTEVLGHELLETVSDPYGNGWMNSCTGDLEEIADVCEAYKFYVPRRTSTPGTPQCPNRWAMSPVFSDAAWNPSTENGCVVADATVQTCVAGVVPDPGLTATLELSAPSPNPAVGPARLRYTLPFASFVRLSVTDVSGRQVAVLDQGIEGPGAHSATWDGRDANGARVSAGLYFVRLQSAGQSLSRKIVLDR
jgi:hypothetical protein